MSSSSEVKAPAHHESMAMVETVRTILKNKGNQVWSLSPEDSVYDAVALMADKSVGALMVLSNGRIEGILSERDYARKVVLRDRASKDTPVRDIMTTKVVTVTPDRTIPQCIALMHEHGIRHLPVVEGRKVIGVLSVRDLLRAVVEHHERCIRDLEVERMTMLNPNVSSY